MELKLPELGEGVHEGELIKWHVKVGDTVKDDQVVCEIMTDKATVELPAPFSGKVTSILAKEGSTVHVGQVMLQYDDGKGAAAGAAKSAPATSGAGSTQPANGNGPGAPKPASAPAASVAALSKSGPAAPAMAAETSVSIGGSVLAAPSTRRFAREQGVDLGQVGGSGPDGRVMKEDIEKFVSGGGKAPSTGSGAVAAGKPGTAKSTLAPFGTVSSAAEGLTGAGVLKPGMALPWSGEERVPFKGLRKKISEKMRASKDHAAHFTYVEEADATALVELRNQAKELGAQVGVKVTYLPFIMKAMVAALRKYPVLNSSYDEAAGELVYKYDYNIGLSIQTEDGLTAPVVKNVAAKSVLQIAQEIQVLVDKARAKKLTMDDLTGGTITLTNAGSIGGLFATPIINYPEVSILGFNKIFRKPVVKNMPAANGAGFKEEIVIRDWTYFSISLDHRIVDGAVAAEFLKVFIQYIENPSMMLLA